MEGFPKIESVENVSSWKKMREEAPQKAENLISEIEGFAEMTYEEKTNTLALLIEKLTENNDNRFIAGFLGQKISQLSEIERHKTQMTKLGMNV